MDKAYLKTRASLRELGGAEAMNSFPLKADPVAVSRRCTHLPFQAAATSAGRGALSLQWDGICVGASGENSNP